MHHWDHRNRFGQLGDTGFSNLGRQLIFCVCLNFGKMFGARAGWLVAGAVGDHRTRRHFLAQSERIFLHAKPSTPSRKQPLSQEVANGFQLTGSLRFWRSLVSVDALTQRMLDVLHRRFVGEAAKLSGPLCHTRSALTLIVQRRFVHLVHNTSCNSFDH
jgi:hypothetical protein